MTAVTAFVWAQEDAPLFGAARRELLQEVEDQGLEDYTLHQAGVTVTCEAEVRGFQVSDWFLIPTENEDSFLSFTFTMSLDN